MLQKTSALLVVLLATVGVQSRVLAQSESSQSAAAPLTIQSYSRMVSLDVVVKDHKGHHISGLTAKDFEVLEQTPSKSGKKREQKIAWIREVHTAAMTPPAEAPASVAPGVYSNALAMQKDPVPPTVLLVDGINTEVQYQAQVHVQMLRMLRELPRNVPVAVFLMGDAPGIAAELHYGSGAVADGAGQGRERDGAGAGASGPDGRSDGCRQPDVRDAAFGER